MLKIQLLCLLVTRFVFLNLQQEVHIAFFNDIHLIVKKEQERETCVPTSHTHSPRESLLERGCEHPEPRPRLVLSKSLPRSPVPTGSRAFSTCPSEGTVVQSRGESQGGHPPVVWAWARGSPSPPLALRVLPCGTGSCAEGCAPTNETHTVGSQLSKVTVLYELSPGHPSDRAVLAST